MRAEIPALTEALTGHFDAGHAQLARSMLHRLELLEDALAELDAMLATAFTPWRTSWSCCRPFREWGRRSRR